MEIIGVLASWLTGKGVFFTNVVIAIIILVMYLRIPCFKHQRGLLNMLPGIFTSFGLLGTFVAIVNSLGDVSQDNLEVTQIINQLVPAFTSSIAGLICALFATLSAKIIFSIEDKKIENKIDGATPEETMIELRNGINNINTLLTTQSEMSQVYNDRLTSSISQQSVILEKFINDFVKKMDDIFVKMHGQIETQIQSFGEDQFRKSSVVLQEINKKFIDVTSSLQETQKSSVESMFKSTGEEMSTILSTFKNSMLEMSTKITHALNNISTSQQDKIEDIVNKYNDLSVQMTSQMQTGITAMQNLNNHNIDLISSFNTSFNESSQKLLLDASQMNTELIQSVQEMNSQNVTSFKDLNDSIYNSNKQFMEAANKMNQNVLSDIRTNLSETMNAITQQTSKQVKCLEDSIKATVTELKESYEFISDHVAELIGNYESAVVSYQDSLQNVHRLNESRENALKNFELGMKSVEKTNENINKGIEILSEREESIEKLVISIKEINTSIECLQNLEIQLNKITSQCED